MADLADFVIYGGFNMPKFNGVIGLVGFLILAYLLFSKSSGATTIFDTLSGGSVKLIHTLQGQ